MEMWGWGSGDALSLTQIRDLLGDRSVDISRRRVVLANHMLRRLERKSKYYCVVKVKFVSVRCRGMKLRNSIALAFFDALPLFTAAPCLEDRGHGRMTFEI